MELWNSLIPELTVSDFERSKVFYQETLGFSLRYERKSPNFGFFERGRCQVMLEENHASGWNTGTLERPFGRGVNLQLEVPDLDQILTNLAKANHQLYRAPKTNTYEVGGASYEQSEFLVQDPDGYLLRFVGLRPDDAALESLVGAWKVKEFVFHNGERERPWRSGVSGQLIYEQSGSMSLAINSDPKNDPIYDSIFFYSGTFSIDGGTITHHIKQASNPQRIGHRVVRTWTLRDGMLTLSGSDQFGSGRISFSRSHGD